MSIPIDRQAEDQRIPLSRHAAAGEAALSSVEGLVNPSNVTLVGQPIATPQPRRISSFPVAPARSPTWAATLIFACLALGLCASALQWERGQLADERQRAASLATGNSLLEGRQEELGKMLADPQTRLVHLTGVDGSAAPNAVLAWNSTARTGFLFCDQLPVLNSGTKYEIWASGAADAGFRIAAFDADPGVSVYVFTPPKDLRGFTRWQIFTGPPSPGKLPFLAGVFQ